MKGAVSGQQSYSKSSIQICFQVYIFELVEVVPDPRVPVKRWYKLKLRARDDCKGPVTAVCSLNGYLASSMGQKVSC